MKFRIFILFVIVILAASACHKRKYPPEQEFLRSEVFVLNATIDNVPVNLKAGANSYYCYSSYKQAIGGVYQFVSELKKYGCTNCTESFYLQVNDIKPLPAGAPVSIDSIMKPGALQFAPGSEYTNTFKFTPSFNKSASAWQWDFGDGSSSVSQSPYHDYSMPGNYQVCVKASAYSGCNDVACNSVRIFENGEVLFAGISAQTLDVKKVRFIAQASGKEPLDITWHFGDGRLDTGRITQHEYEFPGGYPVKLVVKDADGNIAESNYNYVTANDLSSCAVNFGISKQNAALSGLSKVKIKWTDAAGNVFSSDNVIQPPASFFEILNVREFDRNESGDLTKLVTAKLNVLLSDGKRSIWMKADNAVVAVAYK